MDVTTQRCVRSEDPSMNRECSTNDRMLRYNRLNIHFFIDTLFATKKSTESTRGNAYCQLFIACKSFVHTEPLRKRSDLIHALKSFAKEIGVPEALIVDSVLEENISEEKKFCNQA